MEELLITGGACVALIVLALIVRESSEQRLRKLRAELMQLRSQVRLLEDRLKMYQSVRSQTREVLQRIDSRKMSTNDTIETIYDRLRELHELLREEPMPEPDVDRKPEAEEVGA